MEQIADPRLVQIDPPSVREAWEMVAGQLRMEMSRANYESWVNPLQPISFKEGVYRVGAANAYCRDWVESRLRSRIKGLLEGVYNQPITVHFGLSNGNAPAAPEPRARSLPAGESALNRAETPVEAGPERAPVQTVLQAALPEAGAPEISVPEERVPDRSNKVNDKKKKSGRPGQDVLEDGPIPVEEGRSRKIQLQRAYGSQRARIIQPERGMFMTMYFFNQWLPLLGHSAMTTVIAARSLCYWNPMTGELRNVVETDMSELARRASVSVRTIKDVLNNALVKKYFLRYKVRRIMTPHGVRTAGIVLQVRMDDPLTPEDQDSHNLPEEERWYTAEFEDESEE